MNRESKLRNTFIGKFRKLLRINFLTEVYSNINKSTGISKLNKFSLKFKEVFTGVRVDNFLKCTKCTN